MIRREGRLGAPDGLRLYWQSWAPDGPAKASAVLVHGVAEHGGRYRFVAEKLAAAGISVYALDHRGHGRSDGRRGLIEHMDLLIEDLALFLDRIVAVQISEKPFLVGHSLGGAVSLSYTLAHAESVAGLVLSGPAVATEAVSPTMTAVSRLLSTVAPRLPVFKLDDELISRDARVVAAYRRDPLVYPGKLPARTLWQILASMRTLPQHVGELAVPLLLLHGDEDGLCPPAGSRLIYERASSVDRTLEIYPGLYHEIFNEPEREVVIEQLITWVLERSHAVEPVGLAEAGAPP